MDLKQREMFIQQVSEQVIAHNNQEDINNLDELVQCASASVQEAERLKQEDRELDSRKDLTQEEIQRQHDENRSKLIAMGKNNKTMIDHMLFMAKALVNATRQ